MARPMKTLPTSSTDSLLVAFAADLRDLRTRAGTPPLTQMSLLCGISIATLSDAHSGVKLPTWRTVEAYVLTCYGDPRKWRPAWEELRYTRQTAGACAGTGTPTIVKRWLRTRVLTPPTRVKDEEELVRLLDELRRFRGLSLRDLARQGPGFSHHTYGSVLRGDRHLTADILIGILRACRLSTSGAMRWMLLLCLVCPSEELRVETWMRRHYGVAILPERMPEKPLLFRV